MQFKTMAQVWDNCERPDWLFWILEKHQPLEKMQSVRLAIAFAETCIHLVPEGENRPRLAIDAAKAWADDPTEDNRVVARAAAWSAAAAESAAWSAEESAARSAAESAARSAAAFAARSAAAFAAAIARIKNCQIIREAIPNPFL